MHIDLSNLTNSKAIAKSLDFLLEKFIENYFTITLLVEFIERVSRYLY